MVIGEAKREKQRVVVRGVTVSKFYNNKDDGMVGIVGGGGGGGRSDTADEEMLGMKA